MFLHNPHNPHKFRSHDTRNSFLGYYGLLAFVHHRLKLATEGTTSWTANRMGCYRHRRVASFRAGSSQINKQMKKTLICLALAMAIVGCTATGQRRALNTIGGIETSSTALVDGYFTLVIKGKLPTNDVPVVSRAYNSLQSSIKMSLTIVQNNTNALAPASLITESMDLANLVNQVKGKK